MSRTIKAREMKGSNKSRYMLRSAEGARGSGTKTTSFPPGNEDGTETDESVKPGVICEESLADGETESQEEMKGSNKSRKDKLPRTAEGARGSGTKTTSFPPGNEDGTEKDESVKPVVIFEKSPADGETKSEEDSTQTKDAENKKYHSLLNIIRSDKSRKDLSHTAEGAPCSFTETDESGEPVDIVETSPADGETESEKDSNQTKEADPAEHNKNHILLNNITIAIAVAIISVLICFAWSPQNTNISVDIDKNWEEGLQNLQVNLTGQTSRFWKNLRNRGLAHLRNKHPRHPLVFLLSAVPHAHGIVDCLATKLAELLDPLKKNNLTKIVGRDLQNTQGHETKKMMDEILYEAFRTGKKVALIYHLHLLPPPSPILFYKYCDDQNAPYKHAALIFTVHLPREPDASLTPVEAEGTVKKYLAQEVWANSPYNKDEIAALLSRIADTVLLVYSPDKSSPVDSYCED